MTSIYHVRTDLRRWGEAIIFNNVLQKEYCSGLLSDNRQLMDEIQSIKLARLLQNKVAHCGQAQRTLIVADSNDFAQRLRSQLRTEAEQVEIACSGRQATELVATLQPTCVLLDILMPDADGYSIARMIRQREKMRSTIIAFGMPDSDTLIRRAKAVGIDDWLVQSGSSTDTGSIKPAEEGPQYRGLSRQSGDRTPLDRIPLDRTNAFEERATTQLNGTIRIIIADDHAWVREGLKAVLNKAVNMRVVGAAADGGSAVDLALTLRPDVVVMDVLMPNGDGIEATRRLHEAAPQMKVVAFTAHEAIHVTSMLHAGAWAIVFKGSALSTLEEAIRSIVDGHRYIDPAATSEIVQEIRASGEFTAPHLSAREEETLRLIAAGYSNKEVAARLDVSVKSVETYKSRCLEKLGLKSRVDIMRYALEQGWLRQTTSS